MLTLKTGFKLQEKWYHRLCVEKLYKNILNEWVNESLVKTWTCRHLLGFSFHIYSSTYYKHKTTKALSQKHTWQSKVFILGYHYFKKIAHLENNSASSSSLKENSFLVNYTVVCRANINATVNKLVQIWNKRSN